MAKGRPDFQQSIDITAQTIASLKTNIFAQNLDRVNTIAKRPAGSTIIAKIAGVVNTTYVMHTVPAGKTMFMSTVVGLIGSFTTGASVNMTVRDENDVLKYWIITHTLMISAGGYVNFPIPRTFIPPLELQQGWDVFISSDDMSTEIFGMIGGWEE